MNRLSVQEPRLEKAYGYDETASGMFFYGYRHYDPATGRWLSRDPIAENGGINLYAFVENNPIRYFDPNGLASADSHAGKGGRGGAGCSATEGRWSV